MKLRDSINLIACMAKENCRLDNLLFYQSGKSEFLDILSSKIEESQFDAYPFVFVNENTISEVVTRSNNDKQVKIGEIVIATLTLPEYSASKRDDEVFNKILSPFVDEFIRILKSGHAGIVLMEIGDKLKKPYYGKDADGNPFKDSVDAYQITNLKIRII